MADEKKGAPAKKKGKKKAGPFKKPFKYCPKCGAGFRLAEHQNRRSCGKCGYFERK